MTTAQLADIYNPDTYARAMPYETFAELRRDEPVYWQREPEGPGYWAIMRYEDIVTVSTDNILFSSYLGGTNLEDLPQDGLAMVRMMMVNMDPPQHTKYRRLVSTGFTPKMITAMEPHVRDITRRIVDGIAKRGSCDFVTEIAALLPLHVIAEIMGVPDDMHDQIFDWSNKLVGFTDPEYAITPETSQQAAAQMFMYANTLAVDRKANPRDDLVSVLINAEVDGERLTEADFDGFFLLLSVAGNETTRNLMSGAMLALMQHPEQRQKLLDDMSLLPVAVEEFLRWVSPIIYFRRTASRDTEVGGQRIKAGEKVAMYYPSGNRDESIFERPGEFDVTRKVNPHLAFGGGGNHFCLGASLARLEIRCMFEELLTRLPDMELDGPVSRLRSNFINGIKHLPVRYTPE